jgi:predicted protein tyrosine phosphatase
MSYYPDAQLVYRGLFLGSLDAANDERWLRENNISSILGMIDIQTKFPGIEYLVFGDIEDTQSQNIVKYFGRCFKFIEKGISSGGNVLVHCYAGISRSTSVAVGFIMYKNGTSLESTLSNVKRARSIVSPNYGFLSQLEVFDRMSKGEKIVWCNLK